LPYFRPRKGDWRTLRPTATHLRATCGPRASSTPAARVPAPASPASGCWVAAIPATPHSWRRGASEGEAWLHLAGEGQRPSTPEGFWRAEPVLAAPSGSPLGVEPDDPGRDLDARVESQLVADLLDMPLDRPLRAGQAGRDLLVAQALGDQPRHL